MTSSTAAAIKQALGAYGETLAARHLVGQGMVLLDRNWRCDAGEIDLVLRDGDVLVVCEVKTRSSLRYGTPHEAVTDIKVARLRRLATRWVAGPRRGGPPPTQTQMGAKNPPRPENQQGQQAGGGVVAEEARPRKTAGYLATHV